MDTVAADHDINPYLVTLKTNGVYINVGMPATPWTIPLFRKIQRVKTISEYHRLRGLPKPEHSLISLVNHEAIENTFEEAPLAGCLNFIPLP